MHNTRTLLTPKKLSEYNNPMVGFRDSMVSLMRRLQKALPGATYLQTKLSKPLSD